MMTLPLITRTRCALALSALLLLAGCTREHTLTSSSPEAVKFYREGVVQWEKFYYVEAAASFEKALQYDSTFAMAWARLAMINASSHNEPGARANIARAMKLAGNTSPREQLLIRMWDSHLRFDWASAATYADSLIKLYPDEKEVYVFRGGLYEESKNLEAAIRLFTKALEVDTAYPMAVMRLGYAYSAIGEQEKALAQMERYIRLAPDAADPRASYADLLLRVGRYEDALRQYRKSLDLKPDYWYSVRMIGEIYSVMGRLKEAEQQFHSSLALLPQNNQMESVHLNFKGYLNLQRGQYAEAARLYTSAIAIDTSSAGPAYGLALAEMKLGHFKESSELLERIGAELHRRNLAGSPAMISYYVTWSRYFMERGQLTEALTECDSALECSSLLTHGYVYRQMAEVYLRQKAYEQALDACSEALTLNPNLPDALFTLTRIYAEKHDHTMTQEIGNRLLAFWSGADPDFLAANQLRHLLSVQESRK